MNKYNMMNSFMKPSGNSVHKMPITGSDDVKHVTTRNLTTTRTSPKSDTENVKITKDALTQSLYGRND